MSLSNVLIKEATIAAHQKFILASALSTSLISSVPILRDPTTGAPISDQEQMLAYSGKGFIQLKQDSKDRSIDSFARVLRERRPIAQYLAHELYRASGLLGNDNKSVDDRFQLSIGVDHLDTYPLLLSTSTGPSNRALADSPLLKLVKNLKPNGHVVHCVDESAAGVEFLFAETKTDYTLIVHEKAREGRTLGVILSNLIDPTFVSAGNYLQFAAHIPLNDTSGGISFPECDFSSSSADLVSCGLGGLVTHPVLSDGIHSASTHDGQLYLSTEHRVTERVDYYRKETLINLTHFGSQHPFEKRLNTGTSFDIDSCDFR